MRFSLRRKTTVVVAAALVAVLATATAAVAGGPWHGGSSVTKVQIITDPSPQTITSSGWTQVINAGSVNFSTGNVLVARFSAESACYGGSGSAWCSARIVLNNGSTEFDPITSTNFAFDSTNNGTETSASWEAHSMERVWTATFNGGNFSVAVQVAMVSGCTLVLDDMTLSLWILAA